MQEKHNQSWILNLDPNPGPNTNKSKKGNNNFYKMLGLQGFLLFDGFKFCKCPKILSKYLMGIFHI